MALVCYLRLCSQQYIVVHVELVDFLRLVNTSMLALCRWFSWGVASLLEGKNQSVCLVQLCAKYRLVSATSSLVPEDKRSCFSQSERARCNSCLLIALLPSGSTTLNLETIYLYIHCISG